MPVHHSARTAFSLLAIVVALAVGAVGGFVGRPVLAPEKKVGETRKSDVSSSATRKVIALGRLRPKDGVIPVYGPPGDRIGDMEKGIAVGTRLDAGAKIADLASRKERELEVAVARTQLEEAETQVKLARASGEAKIKAVELESDNLAADEGEDTKALDLQIAVLARQKEYAAGQKSRLDQLKSREVSISRDEIEQADLLVAKADAEWDAARIRRQKAIDGYRRGKDLAAKKLIAARAEMDEAVARAPIQSAKKKLELAGQLVSLTTIKAPVPGTVLQISSRTGEPTGPHQPILSLADTSKMVAVAEVYESDVPYLWNVLLNEKKSFLAEVKSPALPDAVLSGTVTDVNQLGRTIARNAIFALSPREDSDRRVVEVLVELDETSSRTASNFVGLQVQVALTAKEGR